MMISVLITCALSLPFLVVAHLFDESCPLVDPPLNLATGALDQLFDAVLRQLLIPQSRFVINETIQLPKDVNVSDVHVYQLDTIQRSCPIQLTTSDSLGCMQRGLSLAFCFVADELRVDLAVRSRMPGFKKGRYQIILPTVNIKLAADLFSSKHSTPGSERRQRRAVRIVQVTTTTLNKMQINPIKGNILQRAASSFIPVLLDLMSSSLLKRLDWYVMESLNEKLKDYHLEPLFTSWAPSGQSEDEDGSEEEEVEQRKDKARRRHSVA